MKTASNLYCAAASLALLLAPCAVARAQSAEPTPAATADAQRAFQEGNAAYEAKQWARAEAAYLRAWSIAHSFDVAGNLGEVQVRLGKYRDAARFLAFDLRSAPPSVRAEQRARMVHFLDEARKHVGQLRVAANAPKFDVRVDGRGLEQHDAATEVFVDPGPHTIEVTAEGFLPATQQTVAREGGVEDLRFELQPMTKGVETAGWPTWPIYVGAATTVVAAAIGTGVFIAGASKSTDADTALASHPQGCGAAGCADVLSLRNSADTLRNTGATLFITAGVVGLATVGYAVFRPRGQGPAASASTPRLVGRSLQIQF